MRKFVERREKTLLKVLICSYIALYALAFANYHYVLNIVGLK